MGIATGVVVAAVTGGRAYRLSNPKPDRSLLVAGGIVLVLIMGVGAFLFSRVGSDVLDVRYWIAAAGMFFGLYMQFYWVFSAWPSGLYRQKPGRPWPEGLGKDDRYF